MEILISNNRSVQEGKFKIIVLNISSIEYLVESSSPKLLIIHSRY